ncbi:MAG TPA: hypothetical protein VFV39_07615, partial [Limnobacter sp.]|nr:hypothetical protein [Limnobacter sp.]
MSLSSIQALHDLAETSLASYVYLDDNNRSQLEHMLQNKGLYGEFTPDQAKLFAEKYALLSAQPNVDLSGFSATLFQDKQGLKVFAIRGTEANIATQVPADLVLADFLGIGTCGYANIQGIEMCRYWKRLMTPGGQVVSYSDDEIRSLYALLLGPILGNDLLKLPAFAILSDGGYQTFAQTLRKDLGIESGTPGKSIVAPGEQVNVTGHSLGGHLAMLFSRIFPNNVNEVVTLNAPTFYSHGDAFLNRLGFTS